MTRIVTAVVLAAVVLASLFFLPTEFTYLLFSMVVIAAGLEWAALSGQGNGLWRYAYAGSIPVTALLVHADGSYIRLVIVASCLWWMVAAAWIVVYQWCGRPVARAPWLIAALGWAILVTTLVAMLGLVETGARFVVGLLGIVWCADTFAYAGGKAWGRHRLISRVSPGKTWEGLATAGAATMAVALASNAVTGWAGFEVVALVVGTTFIGAVCGDLFESLLKRTRGIKDSGTLLPGHGGVLDRIDSLLAAAPIYFAAIVSLDIT